MLLMCGAVPFLKTNTNSCWDLYSEPKPALCQVAQSILRGVNAAVVGLLLAALYNPVWTAGITGPYDFALAACGFLLLFMWQVPPWLVVVLSAIGGALIAKI